MPKDNKETRDVSDKCGCAGSACTDQMLTAAMKVAVRDDLIAPYGNQETYLKRWAGMKACIEAALESQ